jgi:hypothetical protein
MRAAAALTVLVVLGCNRAEEVQREAQMKEALLALRTAMTHFADDNGRGPATLEELVPRYLARVPVDPVTGSAKTWRLTTQETVRPSRDFSTDTTPPPKPEIIEVGSGAPGTDRAGKRWADY